MCFIFNLVRSGCIKIGVASCGLVSFLFLVRRRGGDGRERFDGGGFEFTKTGKVVNPTAGGLHIFSSGDENPHRVIKATCVFDIEKRFLNDEHVFLLF